MERSQLVGVDVLEIITKQPCLENLKIPVDLRVIHENFNAVMWPVVIYFLLGGCLSQEHSEHISYFYVFKR